ncbi:Fructose-specific MTP [uncultured Alphaproteobacteria bacterium]|uniref:Fructose-specific MTP n=1 Tax=uncultured Alphaproteobacteria bacterium TaxID=91750 RepID=A0A212IVC5_9PROT|nr:Fructose-specific MTP [uncultured Alphaproteobacteria bacterium]
MIGVVLVSHSKALALGVRELVLQMTGPDFPVVVAAGVGDDFAEIGTDAVHVAEVLKPFCAGDGAVVLMDLGSAVLSAQTALDLLDFEEIPHDSIRICSAPFVEAAVAASVQANAGGDLESVVREAMAALTPKQDQVGDAPPAAAAPTAEAGEGAALAFETEIRNPHGLHARPAANLVRAASGFAAVVTIANLGNGRGPASAKSLTSVALVQARKGDRVRIEIRGADAEAARAALEALAAGHFGEDVAAAEPPPPAPAPSGKPVGASDGVAVGPVLRLDDARPAVAETGPQGSPTEERAKLDRGVAAVAAELKDAARGDATGIFAAQALVLEDPELLGPVTARIAAGESAAAAWREEVGKLAEAYAAMEDPYLQARAADVRDIAARVVRAMAGAAGTERIAPEPPAILLVDELLPSEASACDPAHVLGILARVGSPTAHAAIIARTLGIPMVIGGADAGLAGRTVALDGGTGELVPDPSPEVAAAFAARHAAAAERAAAFATAKDMPAETRDGRRIEVFANVGSAADAASAASNGAEGVGLLRTEFVYLPFKTTPSEDDQADLLHQVIAAAPRGPVVVRTLDVGADKPLAFLEQAAEANPFLGVRGVRLSFRNPEFFAASLRAILRAGRDADLWIMFPMIADPDEMRRAREAVGAAHDALAAKGVAHRWPVKIGMMVEVPAAALMLERFVPVADFFSIGTNDLTQYVMAAERGNAALADLQDPMHPAVLQAVRGICAAAGGRHVAVCGDAASDPAAAAALVGAGVHGLSVRPNRAPAVKAMLRGVAVADLAAALEEGLAADGTQELRARFAALARA